MADGHLALRTWTSMLVRSSRRPYIDGLKAVETATQRRTTDNDNVNAVFNRSTTMPKPIVRAELEERTPDPGDP